MSLTLTRLDQSHPFRIVLRNGQQGTVGRSPEVDLVCNDDPALDEVQFAVQAEASGGTLINLAPAAADVLVNQQRVAQRMALRHGDRVQAGSCWFEVRISGIPSAPFEKVATTEPLLIRRVLLESQTARFQIVNGESCLPEIFNVLGTGKQLYVVGNFRAAKMPLPATLKHDDDLFAAAPAEVRVGNSLHVWQVDDPQEAIDQSQLLWKKDAAMLLITDLLPRDLIRGHQLHWAWFRSPSALGVQLSRGSAELAKALLKGLHAVVMPPAADKSVSVYLPAATAAEVQAALVAIRVPVG